MIKVDVTSVVPASIDRVWDVVRDFNAMPLWHPLIKECRIETGAPSDQIGCVRNFYLTDGTHIREKLLSLSDLDYSFSYCILTADVPLQNYHAGLTLTRITDGNHTFGHWWANFDVPQGQEQELSEVVSQSVFQDGFNALKERFQ